MSLLNSSLRLFCLSIFFIFFGCKNESENAADLSTDKLEEKISTEIILFDGSGTDGWRVFNGTEFPENWVMEEETLKCLGTAGEVENGGDLVYGAKEFDNFELTLEWKISPKGNSGIFYHIQEGEQYYAPYQTGPEYQVLDDASFPEDHNDVERAGADFAMYPAAPAKKTTKPAGEWNTTKILFTKRKVEHWINGSKVVEYVPWSDDWKARKAASKWKSEANYGVAESGLIGLQDHGQEVWYREVKIREL